jgi:hypothetical protein
MIGSERSWACAFAGCFLVGVIASVAHGQLSPTRQYDKTKSLPSVPGYSDQYPTDHSQPETGIGMNINCGLDPNCNHQCARPNCWNCAGSEGEGQAVGGRCGIACSGSDRRCKESDVEVQGRYVHFCSNDSGCNSD